MAPALAPTSSATAKPSTMSNTSSTIPRSALPRPPRKEVASRIPSKAPAPDYNRALPPLPPTAAHPPAKILPTRSDSLARKPVPTQSAHEQAVAYIPKPSRVAAVGDARDRSAITPPPPSLVSGSSRSTQESPRVHMLRRKPSIIGLQKVSRKSGQPSSHPADVENATNALSELAALHALDSSAAPLGRQPSVPVLPALRTDASTFMRNGDDQKLQYRVTPVSELSVTPSIPYTESPGAFSHITSATSLTSYSPAFSATSRTGIHFGFSPDRKPVASTRLDKSSRQLPAKPALAHPFFSQVESLPNSRPQTRDGPGDSASSGGLQEAKSADSKVTIKAAPVHPPELAYLNVESSSPPRPSRDGVEGLLSSSDDITPVVNSNLPRLSTTLSCAPESSPTKPGKTSKLMSPFDESSAPKAEKRSSVSTNKTKAKPVEPAPKPKSRFGFFSRKTSSNENTEAPKSQRRGPAAGTGHEGYGKTAPKSRSGSTSSQTSSGSLRFGFSKRKSSGESSKNSDSKSSDLDDFLSRRLTPVYLRGDGQQPKAGAQSVQAQGAQEVQPKPHEVYESPFDLPSPNIPESPAQTTMPEPPASIDATVRKSMEGQNAKSTKSESKRLVKSKTASPSKLKQPAASTLSPGSDPVEVRPATSAGVVTTATTAQESSSEPKPAKVSWANSKWNLFQRPPKTSKSDAVALSSSKSQPVLAHYISSDEESQVNAEDLDTIMKEAAAKADNRISVMTDFEDDGDSLEIPARLKVPTTDVPGSLRLSRETMQQRQIEAEINELCSPPPPASSEPRTSRLSSVGRIPKVVSRRDQVRKLPDTSFSRPFLRAQPRPSLQLGSLNTFSANAASVSLEAPLTSPLKRVSGSSSVSLGPKPPLLQRAASSDVSLNKPFFEFGKRMSSDVSFSGSSDTMHFPTATTIAYGPGRNSQISTDESWPEFDDLLDRVITPTDSGSSPRRMSKVLSDINEDVLGNAAGNPRPTHTLQHAEYFPAPANSKSNSPVKAAPVLPSSSSSVYSLHEDNAAVDSGLKTAEATSKPESKKLAENPPVVVQNQGEMALFRFRVLMTSKWLSFGRLLFSPVHKELGSNPEDRILIVDGLGNRDWSYYCAVTYPNTQIYSLSALSSANSNNRASLGGGFGQLPNHRNFTYNNMGSDFPFPKSFFTAVVLRFPAATTELVQRLTVSECKRVLRPGGFLEISTLDLDLTNMGNLARRAVRNLKMRMQEANPEILLKPASDHIQGLLHRKGFENLNRCFVGVPAAGSITSLHEKADIDFSELAKDHSREGDEHIMKLVAQVGRWWYNRCYESLTLAQGDTTTSIWTDEQLLKECEELSTTFKLLICYAQKPTCAKRRTVSL